MVRIEEARKKPEAVARALVAKEIARIAYHVLRKQEDFNGRFKGRASEPDEEGAMAPLTKPGRYNWRRRDGHTSRSTALGGNGKVRGVPPTEIWDDHDGPLTVRAAVETDGESPYGGVARQRSAERLTRTLRSDDAVPTLRDRAPRRTRGAGRDWPYLTENALLDNDLIMGVPRYSPRAARRASGAGGGVR